MVWAVSDESRNCEHMRRPRGRYAGMQTRYKWILIPLVSTRTDWLWPCRSQVRTWLYGIAKHHFSRN